MGKIIRNGIEFSSTVDTANNISYDNSLSGLEATTAQKAIDEVVNNVSTLNESLEWKVAGYTNVLNGVITIPSDYNELIVLSTPNSNMQAVQPSHVPYMSDSTSMQVVEYWDSHYTSFVVNHNTKTVTLVQVNHGGNEVPYMKVYYR